MPRVSLALLAFVASAALAHADERIGGGDPSAAPMTRRDEDGALADLQMGTFRVESASPGGRRLGLGVGVGWPTGVNAQVMLRPDQGVRVGVGAFNGLALTEPSFSASAEWLWMPATLARGPAFALHAHVGAGGGLVILPLPGKRPTLPASLWYRGPTQVWSAARVPLGVTLALHDAPVDVTVDVVPQGMVFPGFALGVDAAFAARLWF